MRPRNTKPNTCYSQCTYSTFYRATHRHTYTENSHRRAEQSRAELVTNRVKCESNKTQAQYQHKYTHIHSYAHSGKTFLSFNEIYRARNERKRIHIRFNLIMFICFYNFEAHNANSHIENKGRARRRANKASILCGYINIDTLWYCECECVPSFTHTFAAFASDHRHSFLLVAIFSLSLFKFISILIHTEWNFQRLCEMIAEAKKWGTLFAHIKKASAINKRKTFYWIIVEEFFTADTHSY